MCIPGAGGLVQAPGRWGLSALHLGEGLTPQSGLPSAPPKGSQALHFQNGYFLISVQLPGEPVVTAAKASRTRRWSLPSALVITSRIPKAHYVKSKLEGPAGLPLLSGLPAGA